MAELTQTAANVVTTADQIKSGISGGTITAGMPIYKDSADSKFKACIANTANTANCTGISLTGSSNNQPIQYVAIDGAHVNLGATLANGMVYCVSANTAGKIMPYSDLSTNNVVTVLGVATNTSNLQLRVQNTGAVKP